MHLQYLNDKGKRIPSPGPDFPEVIPSSDISKRVSAVDKGVGARLDALVPDKIPGKGPDLTKESIPKDLRPKGEVLADPTGSAAKFQRSPEMRAWQAKADEFNKTVDASRSQNIPGDPLSPMTEEQWRELRAPMGPDGVRGIFSEVNAQLDPRFRDHQAFVDETVNRAENEGLNIESMFMDKSTGLWSQGVQDYAEALVTRLLDRDIRDKIPQEKKALVLGGLPGAGKSTIIQKLGLNDEHNPKWVTLNPDTIKEEMIADGVYPKVEGLSPMESVGMMHELSSDISKLYSQKAMEMGFNVIHDVTLATPKAATKIKNLNDLHGYEADAIFVNVPMEMSGKSQIKRHLGGLNRLRAGTDPRGGRFVPTRVLAVSAPTSDQYQSMNAETFDWAQRNGMFRRWAIVDNNNYVGIPLAVGAGTSVLDGTPSDLISAPATQPGIF